MARSGEANINQGRREEEGRSKSPSMEYGDGFLRPTHWISVAAVSCKAEGLLTLWECMRRGFCIRWNLPLLLMPSRGLVHTGMSGGALSFAVEQGCDYSILHAAGGIPPACSGFLWQHAVHPGWDALGLVEGMQGLGGGIQAQVEDNEVQGFHAGVEGRR